MKAQSRLTSYHTHTRWSDGSDTLPPYVEAARRHGLDELGVSDHYTLSPHGATPSWSMQPERLAEYVGDIRDEAGTTHGLAIRLGLEADFFPETVEDLRARLVGQPFDYVIGSVHFIDRFPIDKDVSDWAGLPPGERDDVWRRYWQRVRALAESRVFDVVAHLDLPKKFGYRPTVHLAGEAGSALDAIASAGMAIELNTAGWDKPAAEAYPSPELLHAARKRGIPLLITADAHAPGELTRHFGAARALARAAGYTTLVRCEGRRCIPVPL